MKRIKLQSGVTLIELMIGMVVGIIVIGGALSIVSTSTKGQVDNIRLSRLNQDLRAMMDIMVRDIRRAGFVTDDPDNYITALRDNPYYDDLTANETTDVEVYDSDRCIVYAYNLNNSAPPPANAAAVPNSDRFGFKLDTATAELKMRRSADDNDDCTNGTWESVTDPEVEIVDLEFDLTESVLNVTSMVAAAKPGDGILGGDTGGAVADQDNGDCNTGELCNTCNRSSPAVSGDPACLYIRNVTISITGQLTDDNSVEQTITESVRIRNDKYLAAVP